MNNQLVPQGEPDIMEKFMDTMNASIPKFLDNQAQMFKIEAEKQIEIHKTTIK